MGLFSKIECFEALRRDSKRWGYGEKEVRKEDPKPGYEFLIVKREVRELLEKISTGMGFRTPNQLLEAILREQFLAPRVDPRAVLSRKSLLG